MYTHPVMKLCKYITVQDDCTQLYHYGIYKRQSYLFSCHFRHLIAYNFHEQGKSTHNDFSNAPVTFIMLCYL